MMISKFSILSAASVAAMGLLSTAVAHASEWEIDTAHTTAQFSVRHMMVTDVRGVFEGVTGTLKLDESDATRSSVVIEIDAKSVDTRNQKRDDHLRSADFFDVEKHPKIVFRSTQIQRTGKNTYKVRGNLTMRGVTKPVTLDVTGPSEPLKDPGGQTVRGVSASGKLSRKDWGLNWNQALEAGGVLVGDEVTIRIDTEVIAKTSNESASN